MIKKHVGTNSQWAERAISGRVNVRAVAVALAILVAAVNPAVLEAAGGQEEESGAEAGTAGYDPKATIDIGSLYEPQNLDNTAGAGQGVTQALHGDVYEGLFRLTDDGEVDNLLAQDYSVSDDGLTYTFELRGSVTFHSGATLTAEDVVHSIERFIAPDSSASRKNELSPIEQVEAVNDTTVQVRLSSRSISLPYNLSYVWVVNRNAEDLTSRADGTGPYVFDNWRRGSTLSLNRYDDYWGEPPTNGRVVYHYFSDATALSNALLTGSIDIITSIQSPDLLSQFTDNPEFSVREGNSTTKQLMAFNTRVAPFDNVDVRRAVSMAIDDEAVLNAIWGDYGMVIGSFVPPTDPWYLDLTDVNAYDPDRAEELLAEAGYQDGFSFTLDTPNYSPHPTVAEFIKSELEEVGIEVDINIITANEWYTKIYQAQNFDATLQEHVNNRDIVFYGDPDFYWGYDNPQVIELIESADQSETVDERNEKLTEANRILAEEAASEWLYLYPQIVISRANVSGYPLNQLDSRFFSYNIRKE